MRLVALGFAVVAVVGCSKAKSKLDADRGADVDALWDLAPDGTELGIVATPRAVDLGFRAIAALRDATSQPDFELAKPQLDALLAGMFGSESATPEQAGFAKDRAFAMFVTSGGVLGVMPVGDRNKYMAAKGGTRGSGTADDTLETNTCRQIGTHYVCASPADMFEHLGKGKLRGKLAAVGARGDAELYMNGFTLLGDTPGEVMLAAVLDPGQASIYGRWTGTLDERLRQLAGSIAPKPDTTGAVGFATAAIGPLLANLSAVPVAGGVSAEQLGKSMTGTITAVVPASSVDFRIVAPLRDPKPAQTIIDNCKDLGTFFKLADKQTAGACRIALQGTRAVELDAWVENNTLRLGATKARAPSGKPGGMTAWGRELVGGNWTMSTWGRGTMLNMAGVTGAVEAPTREVALGIHAMSLLHELGFAARFDKDAIAFRLVARTAWTNPPDVLAAVIEVPGSDVLTGKAMAAGEQIAARWPSSPFAADFRAGQGGLLLPLALVSFASGYVLGPRVRQMFTQDELEDARGPAMNEADLVSLLLRAYSEEAYPKWQADHPKQKCPGSIREVAKYFGDSSDLPLETDPWGHDLVMKCSDAGFVVYSLGPDGKPDTEDDVRP